MRRALRPLVIVLAAFVVALGAGVGIAGSASASADPSFTVGITSPGAVTNDAGEVKVGGSKSAGSALTDVRSNLGTTGTACVHTGAGSTRWSCTLDVDPVDPGLYNIQVTEQNADHTVVINEFGFRVYESDDEGKSTDTTAPTVSYEFSPGDVTVKAKAIGPRDLYSAIKIGHNFDGEGGDTDARCPASDEGSIFGPDLKASTSCSASLTASAGEGGAGTYVIASAAGNDRDGVLEDDENDAVIWVPENTLTADSDIPLSFTQDATTRKVTVTGAVGDEAWSGGGQNRDRPGASVEIIDSHNAVLCSTTTYTATASPEFRSFSCTTSVLGYGSHALRAVIVDDGIVRDADASDALQQAEAEGGMYVTGTMSAASTVGTVNFPAPLVPDATTPGNITPVWSFMIDGDLTNLHPGDTITISGSGLPAGTTLDSVLHSTPTDLGTVVAAGDGTFTKTVVIPQDVEVGAHQIIVTATGPGLNPTVNHQPLSLIALPDSGGTTKPTTGATKPSGAHHASIDATGNRAAIQPNILTRALTPFADVASHPNKIVSALEIGLVLLLLAVLPAHLLNATIAENSERFERRFGRRPRPRWLTSLLGWFTSAPVAAGLTVTLATAVLFGFADPKFGFTLASLRLILACGIALFLVGYVANALTAVIARTQWRITVVVNTRPYGLILTVVGVLVSRALHFSPGFLIGLILGLTIQGKSAAGFAWRTVVTRTCIVLAMSIAAWIGYSTLTLGSNEGGSFVTALLVETLVAIVTEGVVALMVELLPIRSLEGERVYSHSRTLWGILYFLTVVVFVLAVIPWEGNWDALGNSLWVWIVVLAIFAAICVGIYVYFRRFAKPLDEEAGDEEVPLAAHVSER